jgi:heme exporter protein A
MRLAFDAVTGARGGRVLFEDVSFDLIAGEALVISGANGAGKSSLLRIAAGLLPHVNGKITVEGHIALADERMALDLELPLIKALGYWAGIDDGELSFALAGTGLTHLAQVPVRMLSTGQRKRATLARIKASHGHIWLLDEPANGLDAEGVAMLEGVIARQRARGGIVVVATHQPLDVPEAKALKL